MTPDIAVIRAIRILLVDDHRTMLWGLEKLIESFGPTMEVVGTATTPAEAVEQADLLRPDIILLDLDLNGQLSLDILPALLANGVSRALILTGCRDSSVLDTAVLKGVRGVLRKDASAELVIKAIGKVHQGELWLDSETLARAFHEMMTPAAARKIDPELQKQASLTPKERRVIKAIVQGRGAPYKVLASQLAISAHTFQNHLTAIFQKLDLTNRLELYIYAMKHGMGKD